MKKIVLLFLIAFGIAFSALASPEFKSLENFRNKTIVIVGVYVRSYNQVLQDVVLHNRGKSYKCKTLKTVQVDEKLTIHAGFKKIRKFDNCYLTFILNGQMYNVKVELK